MMNPSLQRELAVDDDKISVLNAITSGFRLRQCLAFACSALNILRMVDFEDHCGLLQVYAPLDGLGS